MKIEKYQIEWTWQGVKLQGEVAIINGRTAMVRMTAPYKGLSWGEHYYLSDGREYEAEQHIGRATHHLVQLYEQFQEVKYNYENCLNVINEFLRYNETISSLVLEALDCQDSMNLTGFDNEALRFYKKSLRADADHYYSQLVELHHAPEIPYEVMIDALNILNNPI